MIKSIFKDTSIQIFLLEFIPIKITDPNIKQDILKELVQKLAVIKVLLKL